MVWIHAVEGWVYYLPSVSHPCLYSGHTTAWQQFLEERLYCTVEREKTFHKRRNSQILDLQSDRVFFLNREVLAVCLHGLEYRPLFIVWMKILFIHSLKNVVLQFWHDPQRKRKEKYCGSLPMPPLLLSEYENIVFMTNYAFEFTFCWPIQAMASWRFLSASSQPMLPLLLRLFLCREPPRAMCIALSCSVHSSTLGTKMTESKQG